MDLQLTPEQQLLRQSARQFLARECPPEAVRAAEEGPLGYSPDLWQKMARLGWLGMLLPPQWGGSGMPLEEAGLVLEEMGYAALPGPFFSTAVLGGLLLLEAGDSPQREGFLPAIARGELFLSPVLPVEEEEGLEVEGGAGGLYLSGQARFVPDAHLAHHFLAVARRQGQPLLALVPAQRPGIALTPLLTTAGDRQFLVTFRQVPLTEEDLLVAGEAQVPLSRALEKATALHCAQIVGLAQKALDLAVDYARKRFQFGRPIGSFQAVQHHLADMLRDLELCRLLTYHALWRLGRGLAAEWPVSAAKLKVSTACPRIASLAHQVCGGVAFYREFPLELYYRRCLAGAVTLGTADHHRGRLARELGELAGELT